jgi:HEAT repeat protein
MDPKIASLVEDLSSADADRSAAALKALAAAGPAGLHACIGAFAEHEAVRAAVFTILAADDAPVPPPERLRPVVRLAQSAWRAFNDPSRAAAVHDAMLALAEPLQAMVPTLLRELRDPDPFVHGSAARDLETLTHYFGPVGPEDGSVGEALRGALRDDCADVRQWAAMALGNAGEDADACVAAVVPLLRDPSGRVRAAAADALAAFAEQAAEAAPALAALLHDPRVDTACRAAAAVIRVGSPSAEALSGLLALSRRPEPEARFQGLVALASLQAPTREAVDELERAAAKDPDAQVREAAAEALERLRRRHGSL